MLSTLRNTHDETVLQKKTLRCDCKRTSVKPVLSLSKVIKAHYIRPIDMCKHPQLVVITKSRSVGYEK